HLRESPAESVTPIRYHWPAVEWLKVCTRPAGSLAMVSDGVSTTPEEPMLERNTPSRTIPAPTAPQVLSAPPATTGVPSTRPVAAAASAVTLPATSKDCNTGGKSSRLIPKASSTGWDHSPLATSKRRVPAASE